MRGTQSSAVEHSGKGHPTADGSSALRVLLADNHALVRAGIRLLLDELPGVAVVAEAGDGQEALRLIEEYEPDLVLMDIAMPTMNGLDAAAHATAAFPRMKIVMLSVHANEEYVLEALRTGAAGYLLKDAAPAELEIALRAVARGETYLSPPVSRQVIDEYVRRVGSGSGPLAMLTLRQREVLQLVAEGKSTKEIALVLEIGAKTVETHRAQLMTRLKIHDVAGLVRYAIRVGLVTAER